MASYKSLHRRTDSQRMIPPTTMRPSSIPLPVLSELRPSSPPTPLALFADVLRPRKPRFKPTIVALLSLVALSAYIFLIAQPSLTAAPLPLRRQAPSSQNDAASNSWRQFAANYAAKYSHKNDVATASRPQLALNVSEELAALTSFMAALPQNVIPLSVDPTQSIDPQLVLDFDTRSPGAIDELDVVVRDVWQRNPVVIFSKMRSSASRELKSLLDGFNLRPAPTIFDVDQRDDADVLIPLLYRLTGAHELPILLLGGEPAGDLAAVRALASSGDLRTQLAAVGAEIDGARKKKKGRAH